MYLSLKIIPNIIYQPYFTALIDRNRNGGIGRDIHASRLAGGLSAIGALSLGIGGKTSIIIPPFPFANIFFTKNNLIMLFMRDF